MSGENSQTQPQTSAPPPITGVETSTAAFLGRTTAGALNEPVAVVSFVDFEREFGKLDFNFPVTCAVRDFFQNGGTKALIVRLGSESEPDKPLDLQAYLGDPSEMTGINALLKADNFNLLCIPPDAPGGDVPLPVYRAAMLFCAANRAMLLVDSPAAWSAGKNGTEGAKAAAAGLAAMALEGPDARNAALYFPRVVETDPATGKEAVLVPCGIIAGIMARTDATVGVWKAPAGTDAPILGIDRLELNLSDNDNGVINPLAINALRHFSVIGPVVWGARTLRGADVLADDYKYITVCRLTLYIEESVEQGLQWARFEPNDQVLWSAVRRSVNDFMSGLFRSGALLGSKPDEAFFVACDNSTTTVDDIDHGIFNVQIGFAPVKPAEFVVINLRLIAALTS